MRRKHNPGDKPNKAQPKQVDYIISDTLLDTALEKMPRSNSAVKPGQRQTLKKLEAH